jgi:hypothetical protein
MKADLIVFLRRKILSGGGYSSEASHHKTDSKLHDYKQASSPSGTVTEGNIDITVLDPFNAFRANIRRVQLISQSRRISLPFVATYSPKECDVVCIDLSIVLIRNAISALYACNFNIDHSEYKSNIYGNKPDKRTKSLIDVLVDSIIGTFEARNDVNLIVVCSIPDKRPDICFRNNG